MAKNGRVTRIGAIVGASLAALVMCLQLATTAVEAVGGADAEASPEGTVSGTLYHDLDEDGLFDTGEPGFSGQPVELLASGETVESTSTGAGGTFSLSAPPGDYTVQADTEFYDGYCIDSFGSFNPLAMDECLSVEVPWAFTSLQEASVTVGAGVDKTIDFGVRQAEVDVLAGIAIYRLDNPPPDVIVEAYFGDTRCGQAKVQGHGPGKHNYELAIFGAREVPGCAAPGDEVRIFIDGIQATTGQSGTDESYAFRSSGSASALPLVAIGEYAIYWAQELIFPDAFGGGSGVSAWVDGSHCQVAYVDLLIDFFGNKWLGFSIDVPPRGDLWPNCGYPEVEVQFRLGFDGEGVGRTRWAPGIHKVDIQFPQAVGSGDVNCSKTVDVVDALAILRTIAYLPADRDCYPTIADVDCSGFSDAVDALRILQYVAHIPFTLPHGCPPINRAAP